MKQISVALIGAGDRGTTYSRIMHDNSEKFKIVAVAEPITARRESIKNLWNIPESECYESWKELLNKPRLADMVIVSVLDQLHKETALLLLKRVISCCWRSLWHRPPKSAPILPGQHVKRAFMCWYAMCCGIIITSEQSKSCSWRASWEILFP